MMIMIVWCCLHVWISLHVMDNRLLIECYYYLWINHYNYSVRNILLYPFHRPHPSRWPHPLSHWVPVQPIVNVALSPSPPTQWSHQRRREGVERQRKEREERGRERLKKNRTRTFNWSDSAATVLQKRHHISGRGITVVVALVMSHVVTNLWPNEERDPPLPLPWKQQPHPPLMRTHLNSYTVNIYSLTYYTSHTLYTYNTHHTHSLSLPLSLPDSTSSWTEVHMKGKWVCLHPPTLSVGQPSSCEKHYNTTTCHRLQYVIGIDNGIYSPSPW